MMCNVPDNSDEFEDCGKRDCPHSANYEPNEEIRIIKDRADKNWEKRDTISDSESQAPLTIGNGGEEETEGSEPEMASR